MSHRDHRRISISLPFDHQASDLEHAIREALHTPAEYRILKRSLDARRKNDIRVHYSIALDSDDPLIALRRRIAQRRARVLRSAARRLRPVIVGAGPGGLFCALWLIEHGITPLLIEQGPEMRRRLLDMAAFMKTGVLHPHSNICFGAGGAGAYSDGKLVTRIRSEFIPYVMNAFIAAGAPEEIRYLYNPHLGSNRIRGCIEGLLSGLSGSGVDIRYTTRLLDLATDSNGRITCLETSAGEFREPAAVFLAIGHSATSTYAMLRRREVAMTEKAFAVGVRVEHPAAVINRIQYGSNYLSAYRGIETAQYRMVKTWKERSRTVYTFCMCPGGYILNASTDVNGIVTNGMSNAGKSGRYSNAAVVVNISEQDLQRLAFGGIDGGMSFRTELEARFRASVNPHGSAFVVPAQKLHDFLSGSVSSALPGSSCVHPVSPAPLHEFFPEFVTESLRSGFSVFERRMPTFTTHDEACVFGVESRTSAPYRIVRDAHSLRSLSHSNVFPIGEGAGYAGGITSAAVDGVRCANQFLAEVLQDSGSADSEESIDDDIPWFAENDVS